MASIEDVIDGFYEGAVRPAGMPDAVRQAHCFFRSAAGGLYVQNVNQHEGRMLGAETAIALGYGDADLQAYWSHFYALNPMIGLTKSLGMGKVATDADTARLAASRTYRNSEFYTDWARPQRLDHVMGEFLDRRGDGVLIMAVWRPACEGAYGEGEAAALSRLNRHIVRAIDLGARLQMAEAGMETMIGRMPSAVFTLARDGSLRQSNALADDILTGGTALRVSGGRLRTALRVSGGRLRTAFPEDQGPLDRLIACALDPRLSAWAENAAVLIRRTDGESPLTARAIVVAQRFDPFGPDRPASMILTVEGFDKGQDLAAERLRHRFGLSPAQLRVALLVREGRKPAEIALALGLSVETIRSHVKALFQRTGTRRQAELAIQLTQDHS